MLFKLFQTKVAVDPTVQLIEDLADRALGRVDRPASVAHPTSGARS